MLGLVVGLALSPAGVGEIDSAMAEQSVRATLSAMQAAIVRADSGAYMALVDAADPVFAEEQRKWARDLRTRPVASVRFQPVGAPEFRDDGAWTVPVEMAWVLPGEEAERRVAYDAVFRPVGLPQGAWVYAGRAWQEIHGPGVRIMITPGDTHAAEMANHLAQRVHDLLESVEMELEQKLSVEPTFKIYPDMRSLQASIALSYTSSLGGWNEPGESIKLLGRAGFAGPRMEPTVAHELGHAVSFDYGPEVIHAPWWVLEGIAEIAADPFRTRALDAVAPRLARRGELIEFARLADFRGEAMNYGRQVYTQGRSVMAYLTQRYGRTPRNDWIRAMARGDSLDAATRAAFGIPFDQLDADWRAWLLATPEPAED